MGGFEVGATIEAEDEIVGWGRSEGGSSSPLSPYGELGSDLVVGWASMAEERVGLCGLTPPVRVLIVASEPTEEVVGCGSTDLKEGFELGSSSSHGTEEEGGGCAVVCCGSFELLV